MVRRRLGFDFHVAFDFHTGQFEEPEHTRVAIRGFSFRMKPPVGGHWVFEVFLIHLRGPFIRVPSFGPAINRCEYGRIYLAENLFRDDVSVVVGPTSQLWIE